MKTHRDRSITLALALTVLASCGKGDDHSSGKKFAPKEEKSQSASQSQSPPSTSSSSSSSSSSQTQTQPQTVPDNRPVPHADFLRGNSWCVLDSMHGTVYATTRITFGPKRAKVEYIRTNDNDEPAIYLKSDDVIFELKTETEAPADRFVVEQFTGEAAVHHLPNFDEQRFQLEKVLSNHKAMVVHGYFIPQKAIRIETGIILPQKKTVLYPCADFTPSLDFVINGRPLLELDLERSQIKSDNLGTFGPLARKLALKLPIEHKKPDFRKFAGKQFCAWSEFAQNSSSVEVLSIGKDFFRMNVYPDTKTNPDNADDRLDIEARARLTWTYVASVMQGILRGRTERTFTSGEIITFEREFNMVVDKDGQAALIRKTDNDILPADIYRDCKDPRMTEIYPKFKKALPFILMLEETQSSLLR